MASRAGAELLLFTTPSATARSAPRSAGRSCKFQVWRHQFVDLATDFEAGKWLCYRAADLYDRKQEATRDLDGQALLRRAAVRAIDRCLQFYGGYGYVEEFPIARAWRDVRLITIGGGTSEIMKEIIAKRMGIG